ncbi:hypothetical protein ANDA3_0340 [plant metagenome]|uniref:Uncharacterized protein n=2 Tax=root TaxID=1 RepID=A0A1C3K1Z6_9BURK|nr:hypothetical protein ODI_04068 [Orrella dioscoreae]SOE46238.1 hypothetical protein ODI_R0213 [Orrella dioscoreae]
MSLPPEDSPTPEALRASPSRGRGWRTGKAGSAASRGNSPTAVALVS